MWELTTAASVITNHHKDFSVNKEWWEQMSSNSLCSHCHFHQPIPPEPWEVKTPQEHCIKRQWFHNFPPLSSAEQLLSPIFGLSQWTLAGYALFIPAGLELAAPEEKKDRTKNLQDRAASCESKDFSANLNPPNYFCIEFPLFQKGDKQKPHHKQKESQDITKIQEKEASMVNLQTSSKETELLAGGFEDHKTMVEWMWQ